MVSKKNIVLAVGVLLVGVIVYYIFQNVNIPEYPYPPKIPSFPYLPPGMYELITIYPQSTGTSLTLYQPINRNNIGKTIVINVLTTTANDPLRSAVLNVKNVSMVIKNMSANGTVLTVDQIPQLGGIQGRAIVTGTIQIL